MICYIAKHLHFYFFHNKMTNGYLAIKVTKMPLQSYQKAN